MLLAMRRVTICLFLSAAALCAQTADIAFFRAVLAPSNEVPAVSLDAKGVGDVVVHMVRDGSGNIVSGSVDFIAHATFPADVVLTGMHIHSGPAGVAGPVLISSGITAGAGIPFKATGDSVRLQAQFASGDTAVIAAINGMLTDPGKYYLNIHTTDHPGGAMRGQLQAAAAKFFLGTMSSDNEVPPPGVAAAGTAVVMAVATWDANYHITSGAAYLETSYNLSEQGTFTGFHIHTGAAGANGPVALNSGIPSGTAIDPSGKGSVGPFYVELDPTSALQMTAFTNLFTNPSADYINIHTNLHPAGVMRAQLRATQANVFNVVMDSANETGTVNDKGTAPSQIGILTTRNEDGSIAAGTVAFDVNYRLPKVETITGMHIHDAGAGVNGSISIPMIPAAFPSFTTAAPAGNIFGYTQAVANTAVLTDILTNPENHYVNLHTSVDPAGMMRAQLAPIVSAPPMVAAVLPADNDKNATTVAPGGLISIYGTNLVKVTATLDGWQGQTIPSALNATSVTIGGKPAALLYVSPAQINAQVPVDVPAGAQPVVVTSTVGMSASFNVTVAATAPAIFFSPVAAVLKNADYSLVSPSNPAHAGDVLLVYCTGLGATSTGLGTGALAPATGTAATQAKVTASIGGQNAAVIYAIASPGFAGLYQVAVTVPAGVSGSVPVVLTAGGVDSNSVMVPVM
jgi:uncharacterized protein (TIGR03437 family)